MSLQQQHQSSCSMHNPSNLAGKSNQLIKAAKILFHPQNQAKAISCIRRWQIAPMQLR
jgi:hypothetical protein